jgi:hypothetical protein
MVDRTWARLLADFELAGDDDPAALVQGLCRRTAEAVGASGAAITVMAGDATSGVISASNDTARHLEDIQFTLNEGPGLEAFRDHGPVLVPDLTRSSRWTAYTPLALASGAKAVFGFPLQLGSIKLGAMTVHRRHVGELDVEHLNRAFAIAEAVTRVLLSAASLPEGSAAVWEGLDEDWTVVHQATGMVSVQLGSTLDEALVRLRAHAFASGRSIREVADDVVSRRLSLPRDRALEPE